MSRRALRLQRRTLGRIRDLGEAVYLRHRTGETESPDGGTITPTFANVSDKAVVGPEVAGFVPGMRVAADQDLILIGAPLRYDDGNVYDPAQGDELYRGADASGESMRLAKVSTYRLSGVSIVHVAEVEG